MPPQLPFTLGGLGLRKARRVSGSVHSASWRLPPHDPPSAPSCRHRASSSLGSEARQIAHELVRVGFEPPSWRDLVARVRPARNGVEEFECGWQHEAGALAERHDRDTHIFPRLTDPAKALLRSQGGPGSGLAFSTCRITRLASIHFRLLSLRRLQCSLPVTVPVWPPARFDAYGHYRAACWWPESAETKDHVSTLEPPRTHHSGWTPTRSGSGWVATVAGPAGGGRHW